VSEFSHTAFFENEKLFLCFSLIFLFYFFLPFNFHHFKSFFSFIFVTLFQYLTFHIFLSFYHFPFFPPFCLFIFQL